jgi:hypothetical protein
MRSAGLVFPLGAVARIKKQFCFWAPAQVCLCDSQTFLWQSALQDQDLGWSQLPQVREPGLVQSLAEQGSTGMVLAGRVMVLTV